MGRDFYIKSAESRRKRREATLLLLILLIMDAAVIDAILMRRHSQDWRSALRNRIMGNPSGDFTGALPGIQENMASAHIAGMKLTGEDIGEDFPADVESLIAQYKPAANDFAQAMLDRVTKAVETGISEGNIRQAVRDAGYARGHSSAIEIGVERAIVGAFNNGIGQAAFSLGETKAGFQHVSVLDNSTSAQCWERGSPPVTLPITHPYFLTNWPQLHPHCRSLIRVVKNLGSWNEPNIQTLPVQGFGIMPAWVHSLVSQFTS